MMWCLCVYVWAWGPRWGAGTSQQPWGDPGQTIPIHVSPPAHATAQMVVHSPLCQADGPVLDINGHNYQSWAHTLSHERTHTYTHTLIHTHLYTHTYTHTLIHTHTNAWFKHKHTEARHRPVSTEKQSQSECTRTEKHTLSHTRAHMQIRTHTNTRKDACKAHCKNIHGMRAHTQTLFQSSMIAGNPSVWLPSLQAWWPVTLCSVTDKDTSISECHFIFPECSHQEHYLCNDFRQSIYRTLYILFYYVPCGEVLIIHAINYMEVSSITCIEYLKLYLALSCLSHIQTMTLRSVLVAVCICVYLCVPVCTCVYLCVLSDSCCCGCVTMLPFLILFRLSMLPWAWSPGTNLTHLRKRRISTVKLLRVLSARDKAEYTVKRCCINCPADPEVWFS